MFLVLTRLNSRLFFMLVAVSRGFGRGSFVSCAGRDWLTLDAPSATAANGESVGIAGIVGTAPDTITAAGITASGTTAAGGGIATDGTTAAGTTAAGGGIATDGTTAAVAIRA
jgi:hypothetical protein